jgi:hypothetical protein
MVIVVVLALVAAFCLLFAYEICNAIEIPDSKDILDL